MKTKLKYFSLAIAALLMVGFASCSSDDEPIKGVDEIETGGTKMQLVVNMPTGASTRSTTGATGIEVGTDTENKANSVLLSVFDAGGNFVASYRPTLKASTTDGEKVSYVSDVFAANALKLGNSYKVYVYINPYPDMELKAQNPNEFFVPWNTAATEEAKYLSVMNGITTERGFLMSNATTVEAKQVENTAIVETTPFSIVADVERAVARFDYTAMNATNTYPVGGAGDVSVQLTDYKLLNTSQQFYHLKRVNATPEGTQGGAETVDNYVIDTDWVAKSTPATDWGVDQFANNFYFNLKSNNVTSYKALGTSTSTTTAQNLAYVIENTLPEVNKSKKGLATAVVFKGKLVFDQPTYGGGLGSDVYVWNNTFYGIYDKLPAGLRGLVASFGGRSAENLVKAGITSYSWDATLNDGAGGYPVYYVYYNRHNDNKDPKKTGPMEFAVVRNNVYKLSISKVNLFGHSNDPQIKTPTNADPNPEKPEDDIEKDNIYMEVTANVLPWVMRTNVIEF